MRTTLIARACALAVTAIAAPAFAGEATLFQPAALTPLVADAAFADIARDPSTHTASVVTANSAAVDTSTDAIVLDLDIGGPIQLTALRNHAYRTTDGAVVWEGTLADTKSNSAARPPASEVANDPMNSVTLVRDGRFVTGNIRIDGQLYAVRPLFDGRHVVAEVDESRLPPDHDEAAYSRQLDEARQTSTAPSKAVTANTVVRVLVNYTPAANNATPSMAGLINLAVSETNQGYANSGVAITMELAGTGLIANYVETNFGTELSRYRSTNDGYMDAIHTQRNTVRADLSVLIVNNTQLCGQGYLNVGASSAFSVVSRVCATGNYTFAHETGHNFGAHHDPANAPSAPYAYGHGYQNTAARWRTIMAYACSTVNCPKINFWSTPRKTYNGVPVGTVATHDNARVLNQRAATVAAFR